ncbi:MAG: tRNA epoxyqueuosine(34) reductase QueG [Gammaproteobacteria bacterium]|nr:tRNA epoxyqueuosine(34) reductase QueG [Gammaproteobacteria bacterium]MCY4218608.1 tRNA epoxyqueuosine(34) reductase QueG [Gammaproteobacteria bacterium]MCY4275508.1 tRNA epoxyqueuosine(34) reductase QueG [Gammaproteobacteria bacterium]
MNQNEIKHLSRSIKEWGAELGFEQIGISDIDLKQAESRLGKWLENHYHGKMDYMSRHGTKRTRPKELVDGTIRVISASMNYLPEPMSESESALEDASIGYISRYALGRDYHKVIRTRLNKLAKRIEKEIGPFGYRIFCDSAPVMEKPLAEKAGLGWIGKHTNLLNRHKGSWFFIGEIYTDVPLPLDTPTTSHCGSCRACIDVCPTQAIIAPYVLDARRCISYHTIELYGPIPVEFRKSIGNRIYGCDDCQLVCPWNRYAKISQEPDFSPRHLLNSSRLIDLFNWSEQKFLIKTEGSAIRRIGFHRWLRNIAVALGNAPKSKAVIQSLKARQGTVSDLVDEHIGWALQEQTKTLQESKVESPD